MSLFSFLKRVKRHRKRGASRRPIQTVAWTLLRWLRPLAPIALVILCIVTGWRGLWAFIAESPYFTIDRIEWLGDPRGQRTIGISALRIPSQTNIFEVDLQEISERLRGEHPEFEQVIVTRALPSAVRVQVIPRRPIARIQANRPLGIDNRRVVFPDLWPQQPLPLITGIDPQLAPLRLGRANDARQVLRSLELLAALRETGFLKRHQQVRIDAMDVNNLSVYLDQLPEVKMGGEEFVHRLKLLQMMLPEIQKKRETIRYVDLRFKDVIIGPR